MIRGTKVVLRAIEQEDTANYYQWINDEETNQWRGLYYPASKEEATAWIEDNRKIRKEALSLSMDVDSQHIGFIGLRGICPRSRRAEIWIYIGNKDYWGKGIGQDAVATLCEYAFLQMNLHRIWLECNPEFTAGVRCYENVGFQNEGTLRDGYFRDGAYHDTCIMALLSIDKRTKTL